MKKIFYFVTVALALSACTSDEYMGGVIPGNPDGAIMFAPGNSKMTRAGANITGKAAGDLLKHFYVLGTKGSEQTTSPTTTIVFDNYKVSYGANTAGTTTDNTDDWKYVGVDPTSLHAGTNAPSEQSIKYWDFSAAQYDFIAYSIGANTLVVDQDGSAAATDNNVAGSAIKTPTTAAPASFTLKVNNTEDLKECYFTDVTEVANTAFGNPVTLKFKSLAAKVRVAFYETVPGYSVSGLEFFVDDATLRGADIHENTTASLFFGSNNIAVRGSVNVTYPKVGTDNHGNAAYDKAYVTVTPGTEDADKTSVQNLGTVNYTDGKLSTAASTATMAGVAGDSYYTSVFPVSTPAALTLRVNYTLTSTDGSGETIKVYGAKAVVPASYCTWQPNYAYTYIFKISDNTNGFTSTTVEKEGLYPITFDAVVAAVDDVDFNQETITTVATPSVTTYAFNSDTHQVIAARDGVTGDEYPAAATTDIYVSVQGVADLSTKGALYTVTGMTATVPATEANVIDALQMDGRNGLTLTAATAATNITTIPTEDGKGITVAAKSVAKFTATATPTTYAYVYEVSDAADTYLYTAFEGDDTTEAGEDEYYTDHTGTVAIEQGTTLAVGTTYYKKITNNNTTYAVKVIQTY